MVLHLNNGQLLDHTGRYKDAGLSSEFLEEMAEVITALKATDYEPYDQLYGYVLKGNDQYITRHSGARDIVTKLDAKDIRTFLKHYKNHK